jgi:hypothetical protein
MSHPFIILRVPLEAAVSDPSVALTHLEGLSLFLLLFLAHKSKAESWTRKLLRLKSLWEDRPDGTDVCRPRCQRCSEATLSHRFKECQPPLGRRYIRR